ncbi:MAG: 30S ribosome-binding factor RbfA [Mycoplasmataceae bacterium]|nr:30S ribosome-binding factor RbfA [Mycoplasmataceae bacterium]
MSIQNKRKESIFFRAVSEIITEKVTNANISYPTVTEVRLSNDGSVLKVYVTFENSPERSFENLLKTDGYVRRELARSSNQRHVPKIAFKHDRTGESAKRIEEILKEIKKEDK